MCKSLQIEFLEKQRKEPRSERRRHISEID